MSSDAVISTQTVKTTSASPPAWHVLAILSVLLGFASISTDLYLPAMPTMARSFGADEGTVAWTVSGYLIGFTLGQLFWGPVGDRMGRRGPVAIGIVLFILGSAGCALAGSVWWEIAFRVIQAIGASAGVVLGRAMVRDLYAGDRAAQMMSTLLTVMAIAPLIGPTLGGQILALAGWRAIFWTLVGVGTVTLLALRSLPETLRVELRNTEPLARAFAQYGELLTYRRLVAYAGIGGFFYAGMFASIAGTPFAYISYYHIPSQYFGLLFALGILGIMATNMLNARFVMRLGRDYLMFRGTIVATIAALVLAIAARTGIGGVWGLVIPLSIFLGTTGFVVANSIAGALAAYPERAGAVSALIGAFQYGSAIIGSALVGLFADGTPWPMGWIIALSAAGALACAVLVAKTSDKKAATSAAAS